MADRPTGYGVPSLLPLGVGPFGPCRPCGDAMAEAKEELFKPSIGCTSAALGFSAATWQIERQSTQAARHSLLRRGVAIAMANLRDSMASQDWSKMRRERCCKLGVLGETSGVRSRPPPQYEKSPSCNQKIVGRRGPSSQRILVQIETANIRCAAFSPSSVLTRSRAETDQNVFYQPQPPFG